MSNFVENGIYFANMHAQCRTQGSEDVLREYFQKAVMRTYELARQRDALEMILRTIRSKHGAGIIALPEADVTRIDAALNRGEGQA